VRRAAYGPDLAFVHDAGYSDFARGAAPGLLALLRRAGISRGFVVELGCGSGAATRALVAAGHRVLGLDASRHMVRLARRHVPGARFAIGRLPAASMPACDAVVAVGDVLTVEPRCRAQREHVRGTQHRRERHGRDQPPWTLERPREPAEAERRDRVRRPPAHGALQDHTTSAA